jgi:hypothetical protein
MPCDMLAVCVLYIMNGWESRSSRSVTACPQYQTFCRSCYCAPHITRRVDVSCQFGLHKSLCHMIHLQDVQAVTGFCNSRPKSACLRQSRTYCASVGLESPVSTANTRTYGQMMWSRHQQREFSVNLWAAIW